LKSKTIGCSGMARLPREMNGRRRRRLRKYPIRRGLSLGNRTVDLVATRSLVEA
jgi:hypothetical protein